MSRWSAYIFIFHTMMQILLPMSPDFVKVVLILGLWILCALTEKFAFLLNKRRALLWSRKRL